MMEQVKVPPLAAEKLEAMVSFAVSQPQQRATAKIIPFVRAWPLAGATAAAAMLLVTVLWNPTKDAGEQDGVEDSFLMDYTTLEVMEGGI